MKNFVMNLYNGAEKLKIFICILVYTLYLALTVYGGGSAVDFMLFGLVMVSYIWLPGKCWNMLLGGSRRFDGMDFGIDVLLGTGFFCAVYCVAMRMHMKLLLSVIPLMFAGLCIALVIRRSYINPPRRLTPWQWLPVLLFFGLLLLYTFTSVIKYAMPANVGDTLLMPDMLWNVGNANSFAIRFIPEDIRYSGVQLHYHYLTELFAGAVAWLTGIPAYTVVAFYMQPFVLGCVVYSLLNFGRIWFNDEGKAMLFTFSMFIFGCGSMWGSFLNGRSMFFNDNALHIITNINAQATATVFLCIFGGMFVQLMKKGFRVPLMDIALWIAAFFMLSFAKGPVAAIVAVGGAITLLWLAVQKKAGWKAVVSAFAILGLFFVVYTLFFASGANTSMAFNTWGTISKSVFGTFLDGLYTAGKYKLWYAAQFTVMIILVVAFAPLQAFMYFVGLPGDIKNLFRLDGKHLWANSLIVGGFMAYYLFNHYAMSQVYFAFLALFFMHLLAIDNLDRLNSNLFRGIALTLGCVSVVTTMFIYTNFIGSGARFLARNLGIIEKYPYNTVVNADDQQAMEFFRDNTDTTALFATNRIHADNIKKDGVSNIYSAFSGRQSYMEGYAYALTNMGVPYYVVDQRQQINNALFSADTPPEELKHLCNATGITHLVFSSQFEGSEKAISQTFEKIYDSETVRIYATGASPLANHPLYQEELSRYGEGIKEE
ncbi:MAG: hypothetical protein IKY30_08110 [Oscillospiraceae bacterium]|nr:hypothetical protein [Oscillospiraceae bacterium]